MQSQYSPRQYKVNKAGDYFLVKMIGNKIELEFWTKNEWLYGISYFLNEEKITIFKKKPDSEYDRFEKSFQQSCKTLTDVIKSIDEHKDELFSKGETDIKKAINSLHNIHFNAKKDDEKKRTIIQKTINTQEPQNKNTLYENVNEKEKYILNTILEVDEEKEENDQDIKRIHAEINIKDDKVVVSFYEPLEKMVWIREKDVNQNLVQKSLNRHIKDEDNKVNIEDYLVTMENDKKEEQQKEHDEHKSIIIGNNKKEKEHKEHYVYKCDNKKKVKEVELDIKLLHEGKGMQLSIGKVLTFNLDLVKTDANTYEYNITEHNEMIDDYKYLLNNNDTLDIGSDKDIKILNFLFSSCKEKIEKKDNSVKNKVHNGIPKGEVLALYNASVKAIAKCFSFKANINYVANKKWISIQLPYNKGHFLITINPAKKEMTYNNKTCQYTDDKTMRQFIKENLCCECFNCKFGKDVKKIWDEKIDKFVNELDLSEVIGKKMKNDDAVDSLCSNPCLRALCCKYN